MLSVIDVNTSFKRKIYVQTYKKITTTFSDIFVGGNCGA